MAKPNMLMLSLSVMIWLSAARPSQSASSIIAKPGCHDHCGNISIPYPFGITSNCYHHQVYEITCHTSFSRGPIPFLTQFSLEVTQITIPNDTADEQTLTVRIPVQEICTNDTGKSNKHEGVSSPDLKGSPYRYSSEGNILMVEGCGGSVVLMDKNQKILAGCSSVCPSSRSTAESVGDCYGVGCCQTNVPSSVDFYHIEINKDAIGDNHTCVTPAFVDRNSIINEKWLSGTDSFAATVIEWAINDDVHNQLSSSYQNSICHPADYGGDGYMICSCKDSTYEGNPYLPYGCQVSTECKGCEPDCSSFSAGTRTSYPCKKKLLQLLTAMLGLGVGMGSILLVLAIYLLRRALKRRKKARQRARHFKRNGGFLLQQQTSSDEGVVQRTRIFTIKELEKATNHFNENRILGRGGQGTVYKGMLADGTIVAIKRSQQVDKSRLGQFINEVAILCQINHRNVVKLLGCCLETEVPLLVYEFIPNGALSSHIHNNDDASSSQEFYLPWNKRLQIAAETAGALAYLHSSSSAPIYHRDIKSSNILLDERYRAKVSDFGTSSTINIDQTHLTTCVRGTFGYLDPEYFQSSKFTEKSDVYSFGVVLVELLTSKMPIFSTEPNEWRSLATDFMLLMENSRLFDILDIRISEEGDEEELLAVANLARRCLNMHGKQRPRMKEVATILEGLRSCDQLPSTVPQMVHLGTELMLVTDVSEMHSCPLISSQFSTSRTTCSIVDGVHPLLLNTL